MRQKTVNSPAVSFAKVACLLLLLASFCAPAAQAQTRLIVRDSLGLPGINLTCLLTGCKVVTGLGAPNGQLFLVTLPPALNPVLKLALSISKLIRPSILCLLTLFPIPIT